MCNNNQAKDCFNFINWSNIHFVGSMTKTVFVLQFKVSSEYNIILPSLVFFFAALHFTNFVPYIL